MSKKHNNDCFRLMYEISCLKEQLEKTEIVLATTDEALTASNEALTAARSALKVMWIINIIFTVGLAVITSILIWM